MEDIQLDFKSCREELEILKSEKKDFNGKMVDLESQLSEKTQEFEKLNFQNSQLMQSNLEEVAMKYEQEREYMNIEIVINIFQF